MTDNGPEIIRELAAELAADVAKRYRIDEPRAVGMILDEWRANAKLQAVAAGAASVRDAQRTRVYRDAATLTKKTIYHRLRAYRAEPAAFEDALEALADAAPGQVEAAARAVAGAHVSTAERIPHLDAFREVLASASAGAHTVVDVGAGVLPALLGADWLTGHGIRECWAADKDARAIAALESYAARLTPGLVRPVLWNLADGWDVLHERGLPAACDVAWLLKVVPVVMRQEPRLAGTLAATPAARLLISGSRVAMAKRQNIEARERRVLRRFCDDHGLRVTGEFRTEDEFFLLTERGQ